MIASYKIKHSDDGFKYFIAYLHNDDVIRPLCIIEYQPFVYYQMSGYIKYCDNGEKNMSFKLKMEVCILNILKFGLKLKDYQM